MGGSRNMKEASCRSPRKRAAVVAVLLAAIALALPAGAGARSFETGLEGLRVLNVPDTWGLSHAASANAGIARINVPWSAIAPTKPSDPRNPNDSAYHWNSIDPLVRGAVARGMKVMFTLYSAPNWAEASGSDKAFYPGSWRPDPQAFGDFGHALAAKYSGNGAPRVRYFEAWNEPNLSTYLEPVWQREHGKLKPANTKWFVKLDNNFYAGVKSVDKDNQVIAPSSSPYGDPKGGPYPFTAPRMHPLYFLREITCLTRKHGKLKPKGHHCHSAKFDIVAQHPIDRVKTHGPTYHATNRDDVGPGDMGRVKRTIRAAERRHTIARHPRHRPIWVTEFWRGSNPPDPTGVSLATQAKWIEQGLYEFWKSGVSVAVYQGLVDNGGPSPNVQAGLFFATPTPALLPRPKPSYDAFRFPFVADRKSRKELVVWGKAPASGTVKIEQQKGLVGWKTVKTIRGVSRNRIFQGTLPIRGKVTLRAQVGSEFSLPWKQG